MNGPEHGRPAALKTTLQYVPTGAVAAGFLWSALALLDPALSSGAVGGPVLAALGLALLRLFRRPMRAPLLVAATLSASYGIGAVSQPDLLRADSSSYYVYLRSAAFDRDLDFANEWARWGYPELPLTATGRRFSQYTVGPALLWSPFFVAAHVYVKAFGAGRYEADGYSPPYLRSVALGTITAVVAGAWLLASALAAYVGAGAAALAVVAAVATSPVLFYVFVQPGMSHGPTFALAAALVWAVERGHEPRLRCVPGSSSGRSRARWR
jgi:hypothetical protein